MTSLAGLGLGVAGLWRFAFVALIIALTASISIEEELKKCSDR